MSNLLNLDEILKMNEPLKDSVDEQHQMKRRRTESMDKVMEPSVENFQYLIYTDAVNPSEMGQQINNGLPVAEDVPILPECPCVCKCQNKGLLGLPLSSIDEFEAFEEKLANNEYDIKTRLEKKILTLGGKPNDKYDSHTREALRLCMTDSLRQKFNWAGRGQEPKKQFEKTELQLLLFDVIRKKNEADCLEKGIEFRIENSSVTDYKLKGVTQNWLKTFKCRTNDDGYLDTVFPPDCNCSCNCENLVQLSLPIKLMAEFLALEQGIQRNEGMNLRLRNQLATVAESVKPNSKGKHLRGLLNMLMTEDIRVRFNWEGRCRGNDKMAFGKLALKNVVFDVVRRTFNNTVTDFELKHIAQQWFKAESKIKARSRRTSSTSGPGISSDSDDDMT